MNIKTYRGEAILFIVTLIAASGWFFSKYSIAEFPPLGFIGLRFSVAALLFLPFAYPQLKQLSKQQIIRATAVGLCYTFYLTLWLLGLLNSRHFGEGAFLVSLSMLIAPLLSWLFFKQAPHKLFRLSLPAAALGLYLLSYKPGGLSLSLGSLIFLSSSLSAAIYFILNNKFARNIPVLSLTTIQIGVVGLCCSLYSLCFESWSQPISAQAWLWFAASVLIATNLRMLLQTMGQKYCDVTNGAIIMILEPVWTLMLSVLILHETLSVYKLAGCALILLALIIYRLPWLRTKTDR